MNVDQFTIKHDSFINATNFIIPGALVDEDDNKVELRWIIKGGYNTTAGYGLFPSYCFSESKVELGNPATTSQLEEIVYELDAVLEKL